ncbi:hypothetical protein [Rhizobium sp. CF122]|uniref:hypothetical protein n=1 Tax=Rhizobium sp. CF122 TaxID=1144312 RepID=UPI000565E1A1|nr:hypothetical protein [Rhizobium sp. CF122]
MLTRLASTSRMSKQPGGEGEKVADVTNTLDAEIAAIDAVSIATANGRYTGPTAPGERLRFDPASISACV